MSSIRSAGNITSVSLRMMYDQQVVALEQAKANEEAVRLAHEEEVAKTKRTDLQTKLARKLAVAQALVAKLEAECEDIKSSSTARVAPEPVTTAGFDDE